MPAIHLPSAPTLPNCEAFASSPNTANMSAATTTLGKRKDGTTPTEVQPATRFWSKLRHRLTLSPPAKSSSPAITSTTAEAAMSSPRCRDGGEFMAAQEQRRNETHQSRSHFRSKLQSAVTLKTRDEPPAVQLPQREWNALGAGEIINATLWELEKRKPENIDVLELAHAVYCIEQWRKKRHGLPIPIALEHEPAGNWREQAITAWLKAFHLDEMIGLDSLKASFGAGGTGYEHKGKSIVASYGASLSSYVGMLSPELLGAATVTRGAFTLAQIYFSLMAGNERIQRKPHEDLAATVSIKPSLASLRACSMTEAQQLASHFRHADARVKGLRDALNGKDTHTIETYRQQAAALLEQENGVKTVLYQSAAEWAGKRREIPAAIAASGATAAGMIASAACPPAAPIAIPAMIAASSAIHSTYHFSDAARRDAQDRAVTEFLNHIKSYDWIDECVMGRTAIARQYEKYVFHQIAADTLREELKDAGAFKLPEVGAALQLPVNRRLTVATSVLQGRLADELDKVLVQSKKDAGEDENAVNRVRAILADIVNLQRAIELTNEAAAMTSGSVDRNEALAQATRFLHAVECDAVHKLFTGTMLEQAESAAEARKLSKGELAKFRLACVGGALPGIALGPAANLATGFQSLIPHTGDDALAGVHAAKAAMATASLVPQSFAPESSVPMHSFNKRTEEMSTYQPATAVATSTITLGTLDSPVTASAIPLGTVTELLHNKALPNRIAIVSEKKTLVLDLALTEPYYNKQRRDMNLVDQMQKLRVACKLAGESIVAPFSRLMVMYHARNSRNARRELRELVEEANQYLAGKKADVPD